MTHRARSLLAVVAASTAATLLAFGLAPVASGAPGVDSASRPQPRAAQVGTWTQPGAGFAINSDDTLSQVFQLTSRSQFPDLASGASTIYAAGTFVDSGGTTVNRVGQWSGSAWVPLPNDDTGIAPGVTRTVVNGLPSPGVYGLVLGGDDSIYAGGDFVASDDTLNGVGKWNGTDWVRMGFGLKQGNAAGEVVEDLIMGNDFIGGDDTNYADDTVYAVGGFVGPCASLACTSDLRAARGVAQYSPADDTWYPMGAGTMGGGAAPQAFAGAYIDDTLYVGGSFTSISGVSAMLIAQWRESDDTWLPVASGLGILGNAVYAMAVHPTTKDLYIGGTFGAADGSPGVSAPGIIKWDYSDDTWASVGTGLISGNVDDIAFSPDGNTMWLAVSQGYAGGVSNPLNGVARLTSSDFTSEAATTIGGTWDTVTANGVTGVTGSAPIGGVNQAAARTALPLSGGSVMYGGNFSSAGGPVSVGRIATFAPYVPPPPRPPRPAPSYPPGAPTDVTARATSTTVTVTWKAPASAGSTPITDYRVTASPGGAECLTTPATVGGGTCNFADLARGTVYAFTVQARNDAGWGDLSAPSNAVTLLDVRIVTSDRAKNPGGKRSGSTLVLTGATSGFAAGTRVVPWLRVGDGEWVEQSRSQVATDGTGSFAWQRKVARGANGKPVAVKFAVGEEFSEPVILPAVG